MYIAEPTLPIHPEHILIKFIYVLSKNKMTL